jgi:hypothetical protein
MLALSSSRLLKIASLILLGLVLSSPAHADKLKGIYAGSGGFSQDVSRTVFIEFGANVTALLQQQWHNKDPQTWHACWKQEKKKITLTSDAVKDIQLPDPLIFAFKHGTLVPTSWDTTTLGLLGPPKLTPFGGKKRSGQQRRGLPEPEHSGSEPVLHRLGIQPLSSSITR